VVSSLFNLSEESNDDIHRHGGAFNSLVGDIVLIADRDLQWLQLKLRLGLLESPDVSMLHKNGQLRKIEAQATYLESLGTSHVEVWSSAAIFPIHIQYSGKADGKNATLFIHPVQRAIVVRGRVQSTRVILEIGN
jgi:hypothetical protein